jgi:hypothetical protein
MSRTGAAIRGWTARLAAASVAMALPVASASTACLVEQAAGRAEAEFVAGPDRQAAVRLFDVRVSSGGPGSQEAILRARLIDGALQVDHALADARQGFHHTYAVRAAQAPEQFAPELAPGIAVQEWSAGGAACPGLHALTNAVARTAGEKSRAALALLETGRSVPLERLVLHGDTWTFRASTGSTGGELTVGDTNGSALAAAADALRDRVIECAGAEPTRRYGVGGATPPSDPRPAPSTAK